MYAPSVDGLPAVGDCYPYASTYADAYTIQPSPVKPAPDITKDSGQLQSGVSQGSPLACSDAGSGGSTSPGGSDGMPACSDHGPQDQPLPGAAGLGPTALLPPQSVPYNALMTPPAHPVADMVPAIDDKSEHDHGLQPIESATGSPTLPPLAFEEQEGPSSPSTSSWEFCGNDSSKLGGSPVINGSTSHIASVFASRSLPGLTPGDSSSGKSIGINADDWLSVQEDYFPSNCISKDRTNRLAAPGTTNIFSFGHLTPVSPSRPDFSLSVSPMPSPSPYPDLPEVGGSTGSHPLGPQETVGSPDIHYSSGYWGMAGGRTAGDHDMGFASKACHDRRPLAFHYSTGQAHFRSSQLESSCSAILSDHDNATPYYGVGAPGLVQGQCVEESQDVADDDDGLYHHYSLSQAPSPSGIDHMSDHRASHGEAPREEPPSTPAHSQNITGDISSSQKAEVPYAQLIARAFMDRPGQSMTLQEIYQWFRDNTDKASSEKKGWMNSIRHNLSMNAAFTKDNPYATPIRDTERRTKRKKTENKCSSGTEDSKRTSEWFLTPLAAKEGVQSTTRYRKGKHISDHGVVSAGRLSKKCPRHSAGQGGPINSPSPFAASVSSSRSASGRRGGVISGLTRVSRRDSAIQSTRSGVGYFTRYATRGSSSNDLTIDGHGHFTEYFVHNNAFMGPTGPSSASFGYEELYASGSGRGGFPYGQAYGGSMRYDPVPVTAGAIPGPPTLPSTMDLDPALHSDHQVKSEQSGRCVDDDGTSCEPGLSLSPGHANHLLSCVAPQLHITNAVYGCQFTAQDVVDVYGSVYEPAVSAGLSGAVMTRASATSTRAMIAQTGGQSRMPLFPGQKDVAAELRRDHRSLQ